MTVPHSSNRRSPTLQRGVHVAKILASLTVVVACFAQPRSREAENADALGRIELGEKSAAYWSIASGAAYPEVARRTVPQAVQDSVAAWTRWSRYDVRCAQYFRADAVYLVAAPAFCNDERGLKPDHIEIAAFEPTGVARKAGISASWDERLRLVPEFPPSRAAP